MMRFAVAATAVAAMAAGVAPAAVRAAATWPHSCTLPVLVPPPSSTDSRARCCLLRSAPPPFDTHKQACQGALDKVGQYYPEFNGGMVCANKAGEHGGGETLAVRP